MPIKPIVFTEAEEKLIGAANAGGMPWGAAELDQLRGRIKQFYLTGQGHRCCYCQKQIPVRHGRAWDVEHVISRAANAAFMFEPQNLAVSCIDCNNAKSDANVLTKFSKRFPTRSAAYTIVHPHFDEWGDHFFMYGVVYAPITAKGSETHRVCKLYRFYEILGQETVSSQDRRYITLAEGVLFARTPAEAEPSVLAMKALIQEAKGD